MKLFRTSNKDIINECCYYFNFKLPSEILTGRLERFIRKLKIGNESCGDIVFLFLFVCIDFVCTPCPKKTCDYIFYNNFNSKCPIAIIFVQLQ